MAALLVAALAVSACQGPDDGEGADEPIRVRGAQFLAGDLPGTPPDGGAPEGGPAITSFDFNNPTVLPGQAQKGIQGRATDDAAAIAIRLAGLGSGYWIFPVGGPDPQYPGELTWALSADFSADVPAGLHELVVVAIDADGRAGAQREQSLCFASRVPDNLHACNPDRAPPDVVIALTWSADADVDLVVRTPEGRLIGPKNPLVDPPGEGGPPPAGASAIDRDSLASCIPDGLRQENLVFQKRPAAGSVFRIHADLFDACAASSVSFHLVVYEARGEGTARELVSTFAQSGVLTPFDQTGGTSPGVVVVDYSF